MTPDGNKPDVIFTAEGPMDGERRTAALSVATALNHMLRANHFSICVIDRCADVLGFSCRGSQSYKILSALHCIDYGEMPAELRMKIPQMIKDCLGVQVIPLIKHEEVSRCGWFRRLLP